MLTFFSSPNVLHFSLPPPLSLLPPPRPPLSSLLCTLEWDDGSTTAAKEMEKWIAATPRNKNQYLEALKSNPMAVFKLPKVEVFASLYNTNE